MSAPAVALMAADRVGLAITRHLAERGDRVVALVVDEGDRGGANAEIVAAHESGPSAGPVLVHRKGGSDEIADALRATAPDVGVLAWWPNLVRGALAAVPRRGWVNLHPSLLPHHRGKHPNFWALADGTPAGVTLHRIDDGVDTGPVLASREVPTDWEDTGGSLHARLQDASVELFREAWPRVLSGGIRPVPQDPAAGSSHRAGDIDERSRIDLDRKYTARELLNLLRARTYPPHPGASFTDGGAAYEVTVRIRRVNP